MTDAHEQRVASNLQTPGRRMLNQETVDEVVRGAEAQLPTRRGRFRAISYATPEGDALALVHGDLATAARPLVRLHSECLTGDALGSLRCDCGEQLDQALERIGRSDAGVLLYLPQEGRGIGLANKISAYALQDGGLDTVDANRALGLPDDARSYASAALILRDLGIEKLRLLTNNPAKAAALVVEGLDVVEMLALESVPNLVDDDYLRVKAERMGHQLVDMPPMPWVTIHYAQTLDGRIATRSGDSQWISGPQSLRLAHTLRASHDAVLVGAGTVRADDPRLTVRLVEGRSPIRVVVVGASPLPPDAAVLDGSVPTLVAATAPLPAHDRVEQLMVAGTPDGRVDLAELLRLLADRGIGSVLVEGGAGIITSMLRDGLANRLVVSVAPRLVGSGIEAVGDLEIGRLADALGFGRLHTWRLGEDLILDGDLERRSAR
jgi:3,4-dihydroxy 2-butanone 4-phosphate synthase/GTP cyclohydrolase II